MADAAGVTHDITLAGEGYNLVAGTYRRVVGALTAAGMAREGQYRQDAWRRRRLDGADGEGVWVSEGFLPCAGGQGVQIAPAVAWDTSTAGSATSYGGGADYNGVQYLAADATLYKIDKITTGAPEVIGTYAGLSVARTCAATIKQVMTHKGKLYAALGATGYDRYDGTAWTAITTQPADLLGSYAGVLFRATGAALYWTVDETTWHAVPLFAAVTGFLPAADGCLIGTDRGLSRMTGRLKPSNPSAAPTVYDWWDYDIQPLLSVEGAVAAGNFARLQSFAGGVYYWHGGSIWRWSGSVPARQPVGGVYRGMALVGPYLAVCLATAEEASIVWLHDGEGWWRLEQSGGSTDVYVWPVGVFGVKGCHLVAWGEGTRGLARWNFASDTRAFQTGHANPYLQLPAIDGGAPETLKQWTAVGFELGAPEGAATLAGTPATWFLDSSTDMGATWSPQCILTPAALTGSTSAPVVIAARRLWLRVRCTGGGANNPVLRSMWARWLTGVTAAPRRRWTFTVQASDQVVLRDGTRDGRGGRQKATDLTALVGNGLVAFHDLDHATTGVAHTVRVEEVEEVVTRNLEPRGQEAGVKVTLAEV